MALAVAFLSLVVSFRVVAALGRARLPRQVLHLWLARQQRALHLVVAVVRWVDHRRLVPFLSHRALRPEAGQQRPRHLLVAAARSVDDRRLVPFLSRRALRRGARPQATARRPVARLACHEPFLARMAEQPRLLPAESSRPVARPVCREACPAQMGELPRPFQAELSASRWWEPAQAASSAWHEPYPVQMVMAIYQPALLSRRAWVCLFQTAKYLLELLSHRAVPAPVFLAGQVKPAPSPLPQRVGSRQQPAGCLLFVQPRALAEEYSSGSRF